MYSIWHTVDRSYPVVNPSNLWRQRWLPCHYKSCFQSPDEWRKVLSHEINNKKKTTEISTFCYKSYILHQLVCKENITKACICGLNVKPTFYLLRLLMHQTYRSANGALRNVLSAPNYWHEQDLSQSVIEIRIQEV